MLYRATMLSSRSLSLPEPDRPRKSGSVFRLLVVYIYLTYYFSILTSKLRVIVSLSKFKGVYYRVYYRQQHLHGY